MLFYPKKFREIRELAGLTLKQIADALGVAESSVHNWEQGINAPRPKRIPRLVEILQSEEFVDFERGDRKSKRLTMEDAALRGAAVQVDLSPEKAVEAFRQGLLREFILSDLDPVVKDKVLQTIAGFRKKSEE